LTNPYSAPGTIFSESGSNNDSYDPRIFSLQGRIGRLRYLAYGAAGALVGGIVMAIILIAAKSLFGLAVDGAAFKSLIYILYIPIVAFTVAMAKRRLNDLGHTGWLAVLALVPLVNVIIGLYLTFGRGMQGPNKYGLPPAKNTTLVIIGGLLLPIVAVIGIVAAVAIPAYQTYVQRAHAVQHANQL
jgi:uncharacterized membrane protein YhaH (DUF805 family)